MASPRPTPELWQTAFDALAKSGLVEHDISQLLGPKPKPPGANASQQQQSIGAEFFAPTSAPRMHRTILPASVPLIPLGGFTWLQEVGEEPRGDVASWSGDLEEAHVAAVKAMADLLERHYGQEERLFIGGTQSSWPLGLSDAEQFYSLRDAINFVEQWLPGDCTRYPGLVGIVGVVIASIDECLIFSKDIPNTRFLGVTVLDWESLVRDEVRQTGGDSRWLDIALSAFHGCICLQNLEKAMLAGATGIQTASLDWHRLEGYFTRSEVAFVSVCCFFIAAYSGEPYEEQYVRPLSIASAANAIGFDLAKRASGLGGGSITEVNLGGDGCVEIRMRAHLIRRILSYACDNLPPSLTFPLYRFWESTSAMMLLNDRYTERVNRARAAIPEAFLTKMEGILRLTGGHLRVPRNHKAHSSNIAEMPRAGNGMESDVAGWRPMNNDCHDRAPSLGEGDLVKGHDPTAWLATLGAAPERKVTSPNLVHAPSRSAKDGHEDFRSLLPLIPKISTLEAQELRAVVDREAYAGRPVGSSSEATTVQRVVSCASTSDGRFATKISPTIS